MSKSIPIRRTIVVGRCLCVCLALLLAAMPFLSAFPATAQEAPNTYQSDPFGVTFQYPAGWELRETPATHTVLAAASSDFEALAGNQNPQGVIFSLTLTTMRQIGAVSPDDFYGVLARVAENGIAAPVQVGDVRGLAVDTSSMETGLATRTLVLSVGGRRVAIVRGIATLDAWLTGGERQFAETAATLRFYPPVGGIDIDRAGEPLWQRLAPDMPHLIDAALSADESTLYVTERDKGIWRLSANGTPGALNRPPEIGQFTGFVILSDASQYVADPLNHAIWRIAEGQTVRIVGGTVGTGRGAFGPTSPRYFTFAARSIYVLDENESGLRIQILSRGGSPSTFWNLTSTLGYTVENPLLAADSEGNAYVVGRNSEGIIRVNAAGQVTQANIGRAALTDTEPLALLVDRFSNFYVATSDQGVLHLDPDGALVNVIGQPYDGADTPKPGQLVRPVALALAASGSPLYVIDGGPHPQVTAFALDGNLSVNLKAGTREGETLVYGQSVEGGIDAQTFNYRYPFEGQAGDVVTITMKAETPGLDTHLRLMRPDGQVIAVMDDARAAGLAPTDAQIKAFKLPRAGTYTIEATRFGREAARGEGTFTLSLEKGE